MSTMKRCISLLLVLGILLGVLAPGVQATPSEETAMVDTDAVTIEGTNGFGNLLSHEIAESQEEAEVADTEYSDGYTVTDLVIEGSTAKVTYDTMEEAMLVVALYTEDGMQLINSAKTAVTPDSTEATINFEGDMPEFFMASAYLLDTYDFSPLCAAYDTPIYTREMQELLNSTVDDYDPDRVLNLDEDETTNFAVYTEDVIRVDEAEGVNQITTCDEDRLLYVIENADETFTALQPGDVVSYSYGEGELLLAKVASITVSGTTVTIIGDSGMELEDVFDYIKLDILADNSDLQEVGADEGEDGAQSSAGGIMPMGDNDASAEVTPIHYEFLEHEGLEGYIDVLLDNKMDFLYSKGEIYFRWELIYSVSGNFSVETEKENEERTWSLPVIKEFKIRGTPAAGMTFKPQFVIKASCSVNVNTTLTGSAGISCATGRDPINISTPMKMSDQLKLDGKLFIGFDLKPGLYVIHDKIFYIELSIPVGGNITGEMSGETEGTNGPKEELHECNLCIKGEIYGSASVDVTIKFFQKKNIELAGSVTRKFLSFPFYWSITYADMDWGSCPYKQYLVTVQTVDPNGVPAAGIHVMLGEMGTTTNENGVAQVYLPAGKHNVSATYNGQTDSWLLTVSSEPTKMKIILGDSGGGHIFNQGDFGDMMDDDTVAASGYCGTNTKWSLSNDGLLKITGTGTIKNYSKRNAPWYPYRYMVRRIVMDDGITRIGDYAFWGMRVVKSVDFPKNLASVGKHAFRFCTGLEYADLHDKVKTIDYMAFQGCISLRGIEIPNGLTTIGEWAFSGCSKLRSIDLPPSLTTLGRGALETCHSLTTVTIPANITTLEDWLLHDSIGLREIVIHEGVKYIDQEAFHGCTGLKRIVFEGNAPSVSSKAFWRVTADVYYPEGNSTWTESAREIFKQNNGEGTLNWKSYSGAAPDDEITDTNHIPAIRVSGSRGTELTWNVSYENVLTISGTGAMKDNTREYTEEGYPYFVKTVEIGDGITRIGNADFRDCLTLESIHIPDTVTSIGSNAFTRCSKLVSISIPGDLEYVGASAFADCVEMKYFAVRGNVAVIGSNAFENCVDMHSVVFLADAPEFGTNVFKNVNATIYYPANNATWSADVMQDYGGKIRWVPFVLPQSIMAEAELQTQLNDGCAELRSVYSGVYDSEIVDGVSIKSAYFSDLVPGAQYVLLALESMETEDLLAADNILTINQCVAGEDGTVNFQYIQRIPCDVAYVFVCGASNKNLKDAQILFPEMITDGTLHAVEPVVFYHGKPLSESKDYIITGTVDYTKAGTYTCYIRGINDYTGMLECTYTVKAMNPFTDVPEGSFYYEPVMWAVANGVTNGTTPTTFGPNDQCMRAHVVTFLWRAVGSPEPTRTDNPFVDVKPGDFYYKPVLWALENGITSGMDATHFGPTSYCNRAQVVTFLYRTMGNPDVAVSTNPFADVAAGSFYEKPVLWAVENGITNGLSATSFGPNSICNRAQIVTFLYRAFVD